ncbi:MAG: hypothetical protein LQ338_006385 [Usnochroma carphineum]|nr:MAG: hypothetical protein LQ338_007172 [Usnochroma carphineum]KAI4121394.1 MAG: hypothetical protein LQ338_006385 [Usnochroma carphineum]
MATSDWAASFKKQADVGRRLQDAEIITGPFAKTLIEKAGLLEPTADRLDILDNGCGTGAVAAALHEMLDQATKERMELTCADFLDPVVEAVSERMEKNRWMNTKAKQVDAQKTELPDAAFTHVLANFVFMGLQDPDAALNESFRILKPGGTLAFTAWQHAGWVGDLRAAFATLPGPPFFPDDDTMYRSWGQGDWFSPDWIRSRLQNPASSATYRFSDVKAEAVAKDLAFESAARFVGTLSMMIPMLLNKFWSEQDRKEKAEMAVPALLKYMNGKYGEEKPVKMHWVANVATARKPVEGEDVGETV